MAVILVSPTPSASLMTAGMGSWQISEMSALVTVGPAPVA